MWPGLMLQNLTTREPDNEEPGEDRREDRIEIVA